MRVILAEKPSVAQSIAAVLGADQKKNGYLQGENDLVSWCIGHLIELAPPEIYDARYAKWRREDLPIVQSAWESVVSDGTKKQFAVLKDLLNRTDVDEVVCATDAGREGELIFRMVYEKTGCTKPVKRLWISSLEESAIRDGFRSLKPGTAYDALYRAALCRAQADWLVGINGTRLYSRLYGTKLNVGRVMTPTLAMVAQREKEIAAFQVERFYTVQLSCGFPAQSGRIKTREEAERIRASCHCKKAAVKQIERRQKKEKPPKLYDLTALQRDANRIYGYAAQQTGDISEDGQPIPDARSAGQAARAHRVRGAGAAVCKRSAAGSSCGTGHLRRKGERPSCDYPDAEHDAGSAGAASDGRTQHFNPAGGAASCGDGRTMRNG